MCRMCCHSFFNDTATTVIYTLSLHDALPISARSGTGDAAPARPAPARPPTHRAPAPGFGTRPESSSRVPRRRDTDDRSEEHTSELQSQSNLVCRLLLEKKK